MDDFASTTLYNLIASQLQKLGMDTQPLTRFEGKTQRAEKAGLLSAAIDSLGASPIVQIGQGIVSIQSDPTLAVLTRANSPQELLQRWQRLERYYHGKHRVRVLGQSSDSLVLEHYSTQKSKPSVGEDLVIAGLLAALLQCVGCQALTLEIGKCRERFIENDSMIQVESMPDDTAIWYVKWKAFESQQQLTSVASKKTSMAQQVSVMISDDLGRNWRLGTAAKMLGTSTRSLQRSLAQEDETFQRLLRTVRVQHSAVLITAGNHKLAETGYACGFSDQAHFSRDFKLRFNMSPTQFADIARSS